uniref:UBX domain-containing protein n=1 Tax=Angiostrongylus cantonensis TaxID=6313 RepID=A0A158PBB1_ANGCA
MAIDLNIEICLVGIFFSIRTLSSLRKDDHDGGRESDDEGERQGFFVGGSEHSGQQVLGPERPSSRSSNIAEQVFSSAIQHGAEALNTQDLSSRPHHWLPGTGNRVRVSEDSLAPLGSTFGASNGENDSSDLEEVVVSLYMWDNGFSIDDGPLRTFDEPESRQFLESIMQGRVPAELVAAHPRRHIDLRMQRRSGPYEPPKLKPFQGTGARLGTVVPQVVASPSVASSSNSAQDSVDNLKKAQDEVNLDKSLPITQVQIRLPNGQRIAGTFNHSHTVDAVRTFVATASPDLAASPFQLMTTFPNKVIDDETINLKDAGLVNAVAVVKLCN